MTRTVQEIKESAAADAKTRHGAVLPEGYTISWRRYGRGGRWRGTTPNSRIETRDRERIEFEMWWQVAADEKDAELRSSAAGEFLALLAGTDPNGLPIIDAWSFESGADASS